MNDNKTLPPLGEAGIHQTVYRCGGNCSSWTGDGPRPVNHGMFAVDSKDKLPIVHCPACKAEAVEQAASRNGSGVPEDNYVDLSLSERQAPVPDEPSYRSLIGHVVS